MEFLLFFEFLILIVLNVVFGAIFLPTPINDIDSVRYRTLPVMTITLIIVNAMIFMVWQAPTYFIPGAEENPFLLQGYIDQIYTYGYRASFMREGASIGAFATFSAMFMHSDFWHVFYNMIYLWTFGRRIEDACGSWRFLLFYLGAGMLASLISVTLNPSRGDIPGIGASGAISGILGAYLVLFPRGRIQCVWLTLSVIRIPYAAIRGWDVFKLVLALPAWFFLIVYAVLNIIPAVDVLQGSDVGGVDYLAHLGGFAAALFILLYVRKDLLTRWVSGRAV